MKVGDYVRTNEGIGRITKYKYEPEYENCHVIWFDGNNYGIRYMDGEIESSPDKMDLIKVGDYVNGKKVTQVISPDICGEEELTDIEIYCGSLQIYEKDIKSIVTKEQFEDMEYIIN